MGVAIRDILADCKETLTWDGLPGTAAVDAHNALYQFLSIIRQPDGTPLMNGAGRVTSHLSGILFRTVNFLENIDRSSSLGKPRNSSETIDQRRRSPCGRCLERH